MGEEDDKNETSRFLGEGVSFKAKLIGILEVSEARGDRMCQEALSDLKMAIRAAGEHKQRITINIAIDGLRLRDEKTGDSLYHHPVHKISFIAQDMSDSRAFGYIFGSPDTGHRFFGIKTDKAASQVVIAMRDLFQVVFALKKKEIELAKQHLEHKSRYGSSSLFPDSSTKNQNGESQCTKASAAATSDVKPCSSTEASSTAAVADLVNLELELSSLQQGLTQMKSITPSDPFGPGKDDPFGDSFTSYPQKPFLPPPPSGKERQCRTASTDTTGSLFSPKIAKTGGSTDAIASDSLFNTSREDQSSEDWFTPTASEAMLEEPATLAPEAAKEAEPASQQEILSQFDVFTELDPLGTGRSKPYVDKKLFFQELKNPPKKVLKDLVSENLPSDTTVFAANFETATQNAPPAANSSTFQTDPFGDDPFVKTDPFAEADFSKDPFNTEFAVDFKQLSKDLKPPQASEVTNDFSDNFKFPPLDNLQPIYSSSTLSKSPNKTSILEKTLSLSESSPRNTMFSKQSTFDCKFDSDKKGLGSKLSQLHENPSLDLSSESECAPEPPPRPPTNIQPIKPPPLPPKKQFGELAAKPPPRPPHDDSHYDYIYDTGPKSIETIDNTECSPPLPVPARKSRFETDFVPERPKKQLQMLHSVEDDYLQPVAPPLLPPQKKDSLFKSGTSVLLPPPHKRDGKKSPTPTTQVTVASFLDSKPSTLKTTTAADKLNLETLDITLSQLTLSGLNELATKLNIPSSQLSNMTLVQLTSYISNHLKQHSDPLAADEPPQQRKETFASFQADFDANFSDISATSVQSCGSGETYDRYAVFRELIDEEIKQTTQVDAKEESCEEQLDSEPIRECDSPQDEEIKAEVKYKAGKQQTVERTDADRYAALREIIVEEDTEEQNMEENKNEDDEQQQEEQQTQEDTDQRQNDLNQQSMKIELEIEKDLDKDSNIIEYDALSNNGNKKEVNKSPILVRSPISSKQPSSLVKSPVPIAITEIIQTNNHLTSGSLSDVVSGSSPEVDNTGSASDVTKKNVEKTSESWAIFDTPNITQDVKEKQQVQSEEGVSPWSSDSKEFGNGSPPEWRQRIDSESGGDNCVNRRRRQPADGDHEWWDSAVETGGYQPYQQNRRSTDSYDDDCYDQCYEKPRRRRQPAWSSGQAAGGHSSSSRDVSPWEEEPRNRREPWMRRRPPSYDRHRRHDSWDEEDDFEYEEEHMGRFHWHGSREFERSNSRDMERHGERWDPEWNEERRPRRRPPPRGPDDHWCCPDYEHEKDGDVPSSRYSSGRWSNPDSKWRDRKREGYYPREPHESPWEDDQEEPPQSPRYLTAKRNWKRPSSASEMDRKSGEIKPRQPGPFYVNTGGSDGERDRRHKAGRRSKSRDSQFGEMREHQRHKPDPGLTLRYPHRNKSGGYMQKSGFENDFNLQDVPKGKSDAGKQQDVLNNKKSAMAIRKKCKETAAKVENEASVPRRGPSRVQQSMFENDFVPSETESPVSARNNSRFSFENDLETSEAESPTVGAHVKSNKPTTGTRFDDISLKRKQQPPLHQHSMFETDFKETHPRRQKAILKINSSLVEKETNKNIQYQSVKQKSLFEDDFSPTEKASGEAGQLEDEYGISSIREEPGGEGNDSFSVNNFDRTTNLSRKQKHLLSKNRNSLRSEVNIKKSESVNIFARENDPFDDDFFSSHDADIQEIDSSKTSPRNPEFKWTEDFESFDNGRRK